MKFIVSKTVQHWCVVDAENEQRAVLRAQSLPDHAWEPSNESDPHIEVDQGATVEVRRGSWPDKKTWHMNGVCLDSAGKFCGKA
ncbi:MAG: hypothetical protein L0219_14210 [Phycisphaerales bacterium]|nr:hypothetical protein [Phycisphaerales bacterium]MCI0676449.1 hypothetical protein [Phycisphaerales bacterium]